MRVRLLALGLLAIGSAWADQSAIPDYEAARKLFWTQLHPGGGYTLYCGARFGRDRRSEAGEPVNIEHVYPASWMARELKCGTRAQCRARSPRFNRMEADLHNLYPALQAINDARGARRYGEIAGERWWRPDCDFEVDGASVEPRPRARGNIARAMFYMQQEYGLPLYARHAALLRRWAEADPPNPHDRARNDRIERLQGNRNPFLDGAPLPPPPTPSI